MLWYVLERYVSVLLGRSHLVPVNDQNDDENNQKNNDVKSSDTKNPDGNLTIKKENSSDVKSNGDATKPGDIKPPSKHVHLTQQELHGLKVIFFLNLLF